MAEINDIRDVKEFNKITFSNYKKTEAKQALIKCLNNSGSRRTRPPHLITIFSLEYFFIYFSISLIAGPSFGQISFILLSKFSAGSII